MDVTKDLDDKLKRAADMIAAASLTLTAGNGGSHALASHMAQAIMKPNYKAGGGHPAVCLSDGVPTLTAHANDGGWATALEEMVWPFLSLAPLVVLFSSSGKSENIANVAELARANECDVIAFTGFDGEPLRSLATLSIHVESHDYEVVEPMHDALLHRVQYHLRTGRK